MDNIKNNLIKNDDDFCEKDLNIFVNCNHDFTIIINDKNKLPILL